MKRWRTSVVPRRSTSVATRPIHALHPDLFEAPARRPRCCGRTSIVDGPAVAHPPRKGIALRIDHIAPNLSVLDEPASGLVPGASWSCSSCSGRVL